MAYNKYLSYFLYVYGGQTKTAKPNSSPFKKIAFVKLQGSGGYCQYQHRCCRADIVRTLDRNHSNNGIQVRPEM